MEFTLLADHRVKIAESEKTYKYLELARELKKLCNIKVTVIPIVIGVLGTIPPKLIEAVEDLKIKVQVETTQNTVL